MGVETHQRRRLPAGRDFHKRRRPFGFKPRVFGIPGTDGDNDSDDESIAVINESTSAAAAGGITKPITLTFISTISTASTASKTSVVSLSTASRSTSSLQSIATTSSSSTTSRTLASTSASTSSSTSALATSPSASVISSAAGATQNNGTSSSDTLPTTSKSPSGGLIAGIAIAVLVVVALLVVVLVRRILRQRREEKRRTNTRWLSGISAGSSLINAEKFNVTPGGSSGVDNNSALRTPPSLTPGFYPGAGVTSSPSLTFNVPFVAPSFPTPTFNAGAGPTAPGSPQTVPFTAQHSATVKVTFIPSLPDELTILNGEVLNVVQEYDDGWALCTNMNGETGMVPLECLDRGASRQGGGGSDALGVPGSSGNLRRASSLLGRS